MSNEFFKDFVPEIMQEEMADQLKFKFRYMELAVDDWIKEEFRREFFIVFDAYAFFISLEVYKKIRKSFNDMEKVKETLQDYCII